jgi:maltooligosyltrehalose trehalohydrolase
MTEFRVWAPNATRMTLSLGTDTAADDVAMTPAACGWWTVDAGSHAAPDADVDYGFRIDGGPVRPDPRSRRQPRGVHQRSRTFDPSRHDWHDAEWTGVPLEGSVIYELHVGTFTPDGTFDAAADRLDHLVELGVTTVELLPVNAFNGPWNWGYDGVLWFAVHEEYGGPAGYQRFVDACHTAGLAVIQDVVYNHLGASGNYLPEFGPYLRADASNTWGAAVNLDGPGSDEVRRYILDNARMWFEDYHVDGLRLDAVHALRDSRALTLLEELAVETDALGAALGRPLQLIAESDLNDPRLFTARGVGGLGLAASWNDDVHHAIHVAVTGETAGYYADFAPLSALTKVLQRGYFHDGTYSSFRGRTHGRPIDTVVTPPWRLITSIQTHDQVGNRAAGDRLAQQAGTRAQAVAAVLLFTAPFTPMLFMGEEWAASTPWPFFTSHPEPELAEKTRTGRLEEFSRHGWDASLVPDPQDPATFHGAKLNWSERSDGVHATMLALYRDVLRLRRSHRDVIGVPWTQTHIEADENARWIVIRRGGVTVAANLARHGQAVPLGPAAGPASRSLAVATDREARLDPDAATVTLPPLSAVAVA